MATISELVAKVSVVDSDQIATDDGIQTTKMTVAQVKNYVLLGNCATATKLNAKANINGLEFDGSADVSNYGVCTTVAGTAEKAVSITDFELLIGAEVFVSFSEVNSASNITLNVSAKGAKPIKLWGNSVSGDIWNANDILHLKYDGTNWNIVNVNSNMITNAIPPDVSTATSVLAYTVQTADINMWLYIQYSVGDYDSASLKIGTTNPPTELIWRQEIIGARTLGSQMFFIPKGYYYQVTKTSGVVIDVMTKYACIGE